MHGIKLESFYSKLPICLQNLACSLEGWKLRRKRFTRNFYKYLDFLEKSSLWDDQQLLDYQEKRLSELLDFVYGNVPYYQQMFRSLGVEPRDIKILQDYRKLPFLDKEHVRQKGDTLIATNHMGRTLERGHTSGTTGKALNFYYSPETIAFEFACAWRFYRKNGIKIDDPYATFNGRMIATIEQQKPPFWRYNFTGNQTLFSQHHASTKNLQYYIQELERIPRSYWQGYPSFINLIANKILENQKGLTNGPKVVFTSSETLFESYKKNIEKATGARVFNRYSLAEYCCSMSQCKAGNMHVDMEAGIVEINPHFEDNKSITGEIICTGLHNYAMPLIRYRTGDIGTMLKGTCSCGRQGQVFTHIDGRIEDYILTPAGVRIGRMDHIFKDTQNVKESQILQENVNRLIIKIVPRQHYSKKDEAQLLKNIQQRIGTDINIEFDYVNEIPRQSNGKFRAVVSKIKQNAN